MRFWFVRRGALLAILLVGATSACVSNYSTDIPINYQNKLKEKYVGKRAWTRATMQSEKKTSGSNRPRGQDRGPDLHRTGS
jgi:hypothetical protein